MNVLNAQGRVFIAEARLYGDSHEYYGCMRADALSKQGRTIAPQYDGGDIVAQISTRGGLWTVSLTGNMTYDQSSILKRALDSGAILQVQIHYGTAGNPSDFTNYEAAWVLENAFVTDYSTTPLVAGSRGEIGLVSETVTLSFESARWVVPTVTRLRHSTISGVVTAIAVSPNGDCQNAAVCGRVYLLIAEQVDSLTQTYRVMWSDDEGRTFQTASILTSVPLIVSTVEYLKVAATAQNLFIALGSRVLAVSHNSLIDGTSFAPVVVAGPSVSWPIVTLRSADNGIYAIDSGGSVYYISDALVAEQLINNTYGLTNGPEGRATFLFGGFVDGSNAILRMWTNQDYHALSVIVGQTPFTVLTEDKDSRIWVATEDGKLYLGGLKGAIFKQISDFAPHCVADMVFLSHSIGYAAAGPYVYQTINAGYTWERLPNPAPGNVQLLTLALCGDALYVGGAAQAGSDCLSHAQPPEAATPVFARVV